MIIQDGRGTGQMMAVDDHGRAYVNANMVSHEQHHASFHQNLFSTSFETTLAAGTETAVLFYKNTHAGRDYEFYGAVVSSTGDTTFRFYNGATYTSGGTVPEIGNMNVGSGKTSINDIYEGGASADLTLSTSLQVRKGSYQVGGYRPWNIDFKGGLILQTGNTFHMTAVGTAADVVTISLLFARHSSGYKL